MAEFLIYDKDHWMDKLNQEEYDKLMAHSHGAEKFLSRYQKGDIVEVRPDGFWTGPKARGFNQTAFQVVAVPDFEVDKRYMESSPAKKRRYNIPMENKEKVIIISNIEDLQIVDKDKWLKS